MRGHHDAVHGNQLKVAPDDRRCTGVAGGDL